MEYLFFCLSISNFTDSIIGTLLGGVAGGLAGGLAGAFAAYWLNRVRDILAIKRDVLRRVLGYRWSITTNHIEDPQYAGERGHFFTALNEVSVVFARDKKVQSKLDQFNDAVNSEEGFRSEDVPPLVMAMVEASKLKRVCHKDWDAERFEYAFSPRTIPRGSGRKR